MGKTGETVAIETKFGLVLNGPPNEKASQGHVTIVNETETQVLDSCFEPAKVSDSPKTESLETDLKTLWDLETLGIIQKEKSMHDHFNERRHETNLPFKINTAQKMTFSIKDFFSKCDQIRRNLRIWSHLLKKSFMENFIFCAAKPPCTL